MLERSGPAIEMTAGIVGVFALTAECESFGYRHTMIGFILTLYVLRGIRRHKDRYEKFLYSAVASLLILLAVGKPLDWIRDNWLRAYMSRDGALALTWLILLWALVIVQRPSNMEREVTCDKTNTNGDRGDSGSSGSRRARSTG